jgi:hypothetical protein
VKTDSHRLDEDSATPVNSRTLALASVQRLELNDGVTHSDDAADQDVRVDSGPMRELPDDPRARHLLEMTTRLAELHAEAFDLADAKALADEAVHIHIPHGHLPSSLTRPKSGLLDNLGCNERQRLARGSSAGAEMAVTFEPLSGDSLYGFDRPKLGLAWSPEMDRLH